MASVASVSTTADANSNSIVITKPTGLAEGDYMTAHLTFGTAATINSVPSGFSLHKLESGETATKHAVYGKEADSSDASATDFTFGLSTNVDHRAAMLRITGQKDTGAFDQATSVSDNNNNTTITIPGVTPANTGSLYILSGGIVGSALTYSGYTCPTSDPTWTEHVDVNDNPSLFVASGTRGVATATGDFTVTQSASDHDTGVLVVINTEPVNVTVSPAVVTATFSVVAPAVSGGANVSTTVITMTATVQAPTVSTPASKWDNTDKTSAATFTDVTKNAASPSNVSKNSATWSNTSKTP